MLHFDGINIVIFCWKWFFFGNYRSQRSCGKVMFSQASVILFTVGGGVSVRETPWTETLLPVQRPPFPRTETPLWIDPLDRDPLPQTENPLPQTDPPLPLDRDPPLDKDPPGQRPPRQRLPRQRPPAPLDRDPTPPSYRDTSLPPTRTVTSIPYASYWNAFLFFRCLCLSQNCADMRLTASREIL